MFTSRSTPKIAFIKCAVLVENAPAKAKALDLETLMAESEPQAEQTEGKLDLVDLAGNSEFLSLLVTVFSSVLC